MYTIYFMAVLFLLMNDYIDLGITYKGWGLQGYECNDADRLHQKLDVCADV